MSDSMKEITRYVDISLHYDKGNHFVVKVNGDFKEDIWADNSTDAVEQFRECYAQKGSDGVKVEPIIHTEKRRRREHVREPTKEKKQYRTDFDDLFNKAMSILSKN